MRNPTILIVENSPSEQFVLTRLLKRFEYDAHIAGNAEMALAAMNSNRYVAVLMDIGLGQGLDGYECSKYIRKMEAENGTRRTPIIALTYRADKEEHSKAKESGMDDFMSKPFDPEDLRKMLLRHVYIPDQPNLLVLSPVADEIDRAV